MHFLQTLNAVVCSQVNKDELTWSAAPHGPPQLVHNGTYKLSESGFPSMGPTVSPPALSKFLSAISGKQIQNPASEMLASRGLFMHDLLELFSGHTVPGRVRLYNCPELLPVWPELLLCKLWLLQWSNVFNIMLFFCLDCCMKTCVHIIIVLHVAFLCVSLHFPFAFAVTSTHANSLGWHVASLNLVESPAVRCISSTACLISTYLLMYYQAKLSQT